MTRTEVSAVPPIFPTMWALLIYRFMHSAEPDSTFVSCVSVSHTTPLTKDKKIIYV